MTATDEQLFKAAQTAMLSRVGSWSWDRTYLPALRALYEYGVEDAVGAFAELQSELRRAATSGPGGTPEERRVQLAIANKLQALVARTSVFCPACRGNGWDYAAPQPGEPAGGAVVCPACDGRGRVR